VVDPAYRNRGVGHRLLHKLIEIAAGKGLKKLMFEVVADTGEAAKGAAQLLGFVPVAVLPAHVKDYCGNIPWSWVCQNLRLRSQAYSNAPQRSNSNTEEE
jgi:GNAT superfamily N-acetyltransferase